MMVATRVSRPLRWAAQVTADDEAKLANYFQKIRVVVRLDPAFERNTDARETVFAAVNMLLRFCPGLAVAIGDVATELVGSCRDLAREILGNPDWVEIISPDADLQDFD